MIRKTYRIPDMHCDSCAMTLESIEHDLDGIRTIQANYYKQTLMIEFDETRLTEQQILSSIQELHYTPVPLNP